MLAGGDAGASVGAKRRSEQIMDAVKLPERGCRYRLKWPLK